MSDNLHQLAAQVAGGLTQPPTFEQGALASLYTLVPLHPQKIGIILASFGALISGLTTSLHGLQLPHSVQPSHSPSHAVCVLTFYLMVFIQIKMQGTGSCITEKCCINNQPL